MPFQILLEFPLSHADSLPPAIHPFEHRVSHLEVKLLQTTDVATDAKIAVMSCEFGFKDWPPVFEREMLADPFKPFLDFLNLPMQVLLGRLGTHNEKPASAGSEESRKTQKVKRF